jgi:glycosyltransferase involved in cell wall biosynthesis
LIVPRQGLGQAYIDAIPFIRGKWVLVGDADLTYDFRQLSPFVEELKAGKEFIMGKRFKGHIVKGDVPVLHQYFVTPLTTWILNLLYRTNFTDIHCGMRGITLKALQKIRLQSQGWEYASELVQSPLFIASPQKKLNKIYLAGLKAWTNKKIYVCHIGLVF